MAQRVSADQLRSLGCYAPLSKVSIDKLVPPPILVRVVAVGMLARSPKTRFAAILMDAEGTKIGITCWDDAATKHFKTFTLHAVLSIAKYTVQFRNEIYDKSGHSCSICIGGGASATVAVSTTSTTIGRLEYQDLEKVRVGADVVAFVVSCSRRNDVLSLVLVDQRLVPMTACINETRANPAWLKITDPQLWGFASIASIDKAAHIWLSEFHEHNPSGQVPDALRKWYKENESTFAKQLATKKFRFVSVADAVDRVQPRSDGHQLPPIDVLLFVLRVGPVVKTAKTQYRDLFLSDSTFSIVGRAWGNAATTITESLINKTCAFKNVRVHAQDAHVSFNLGEEFQVSDETKLEVVEERLLLPLSAPMKQVATQQEIQWASIARLKLLSASSYHIAILAIVSPIGVESPFWYMACTKCKKKINESGACPVHNQVESQPRYLDRLMCADATGSVEMVAFGDAVADLVGHSEAECQEALKLKKDISSWRKLFVMKELIVQVSATPAKFVSTSKSSTQFTIVQSRSVDHKSLAQRLESWTNNNSETRAAKKTRII